MDHCSSQINVALSEADDRLCAFAESGLYIMRIAIFINDLTCENVHLMPWRTVVEVAIGMGKAGHKVLILSGRPRTKGGEWLCRTVSIREVAKPRTSAERLTLLDQIREENLDILYWPFAWLGARKARRFLNKLSMQIVGYVPGSRYLFRSVLRAIPSIGLGFALPYLAQSLYSTSRLVTEMKLAGVESVVTMTEFNSQTLIRGGWPKDRVAVTAPGKSPLVTPDIGSPFLQRIMKAIGKNPFFLFFGPPTPIRGVNQLLDAFPRIAMFNGDARLVCLFRADSNVNIPLVRQRIKKLGLGGRIHCIWESVTRGELAAFLNACHVVVLPFLLVPSEIPLAIIEAAGYGKPVISTGPSGTGEYVKRI